MSAESVGQEKNGDSGPTNLHWRRVAERSEAGLHEGEAFSVKQLNVVSARHKDLVMVVEDGVCMCVIVCVCVEGRGLHGERIGAEGRAEGRHLRQGPCGSGTQCTRPG